jgi:hypothetical protein
VACAAGTGLGRQGRRAAHAAPRGRAAAASGGPAAGGLGRPGVLAGLARLLPRHRPGAGCSSGPRRCCAGSEPCPTPLELPAPPALTAELRALLRAGQGEPDGGSTASWAGWATRAGSGQHRLGHPPPRRRRSRTDAVGGLLAAVPAGQATGRAGGDFLHRRHRLAAAVRVVRGRSGRCRPSTPTITTATARAAPWGQTPPLGSAEPPVVGDHGKPQVEGLGDQLIHQGRDHGIHHPGQS